MPLSPWLRYPRVLFTAPFVIIVLPNIFYNVFPDPPAVQEAQERKLELAKRRREERLTREIEERVDRLEEQHPGWLEGKWPDSASTMLAEAEEFLGEGRAEDALPIALRALDTLRKATTGQDDTTIPTAAAALPALNLVAEINLELGDAPTARSYFLQAVSLDPDGKIPTAQGGGAEKFLYLAQLSDSGGQDSVTWFMQGAAILRREIALLRDNDGTSEEDEEDEEEEEEEESHSKRKKLAEALCGIIEVYMTDLSWDPIAETRCEELISEALLVAPRCAEPLQTLASIRISQGRVTEARKALRDSMAIWAGRSSEEGEEEEDDDDDDSGTSESGSVPDFATRISLSRLLMEVSMEEQALGVLERLVAEDDGSVEAWYLGGWGLYLLGEKQKQKHDGRNETHSVDDDMTGKNGDGNDREDAYIHSLISSREWLNRSLALYEMVGYEDERLKAHAGELVREIEGVVGEEGGEEGEGEEWNGFGDDDDEDEEMDDG